MWVEVLLDGHMWTLDVDPWTGRVDAGFLLKRAESAFVLDVPQRLGAEVAWINGTLDLFESGLATPTLARSARKLRAKLDAAVLAAGGLRESPVR